VFQPFTSCTASFYLSVTSITAQMAKSDITSVCSQQGQDVQIHLPLIDIQAMKIAIFRSTSINVIRLIANHRKPFICHTQKRLDARELYQRRYRDRTPEVLAGWRTMESFSGLTGFAQITPAARMAGKKKN